MEIVKTPLKGLLVLKAPQISDQRGGFRKLFSSEMFEGMGLETHFKEFYYSVNHAWVLRGMHFQAPPADHVKMVYVTEGSILDVVVDIRSASPTYGKCFSIKLDASSAEYLYIPEGFAHGFLSLEEGTVVNYAQSSCYDAANDCGIDSLSIGFDWGVEAPVRSGRDLAFPTLSEFTTPF